MKAFISWSGNKSKGVAAAFRNWLPDIFQGLDPFMSDQDIGSGARWLEVISEKLELSDFGIIVVTRGNQANPWLLFEAGAMSNALAKSGDKARVVPILVDFERATDLLKPLGQFQARQITSKDMFRLVTDLNQLGERPVLSPERLKRAFDKYWPDLKAECERAQQLQEATSDNERSDGDVLREVLSVSRAMERQMERLNVQSRVIAAHIKGIDLPVIYSSGSGAFTLTGAGGTIRDTTHAAPEAAILMAPAVSPEDRRVALAQMGIDESELSKKPKLKKSKRRRP